MGAMPPTGALIVSVSGAGKSTFVREAGDPDILDGDEIIQSMIEWPDVDHWWEDEDLNEQTSKAIQVAMTEFLSANPDKLVLFSPHPHFTPQAAVTVMVVPSVSNLRRNLEARAAEGNLSQPTDLHEVLSGLKSWEEEAMWQRWPRVASFAAAVRICRAMMHANNEAYNLKEKA